MRSIFPRIVPDERQKMICAKTNPRRKNSLLISLYRWAAVVIITLLWVRRQQANAYLERGWQFFRTNWLFQHDSFEPFLSAASFFFFVGFWGFLDFFVPSASKHRTFPSDDLSSWFGGTRIRDQALWYILPLVTLDLLFPRRQLPESPPSLARLVLEVVGAIAVYDIAFFAWHCTVHSYPALYRRVHAVHHRCHVQRAPEVFQKMTARHSTLHRTVETTSCQSERDFSGLGFIYNNLRQAMTPDRVEMIMFLRSNPHLIPEITKLDNELGKLLAAQQVGKAKAASVQAACAGKQVVVEVESD